jgi:HSP20 family protein
MLPSIFGENLFDDFFDDSFDEMMHAFQTHNPLYGKHAKNLMKTDVRETDNTYELDIDLPGFKKDEVSVQLENGYLTISAAKGLDKDSEDKKGKYLRKERYAGQCSRSFYVGDSVESKDISAHFEDGILRITLPKEAPKQLPEKHTILIG